MLAIAAGVFGFIWSHRPGASTAAQSPPTTHAATNVPVLVLNGSGVAGVAGKGVDALRPLGYPGRSANAAQAVTATEVLVADGFEADGIAVAGALGEPTAPLHHLTDPGHPEVGDSGDAKVVVVLSKGSPLVAPK
jgi:LytR cell envelope-related transcriptional attenuator